MQQTEQFKLSQWNAEDRILMEDFNGDNAKIEAALKEGAAAREALAQAVAKCGNCKIVYGSYTGGGTYGSDNPCMLTFAHKPVLVLVQASSVTQDRDHKLRMLRGANWVVGLDQNYTWTNTVSWTELGVQWYNSHSASTQFNASGSTYYYAALLAADE